MRTTRLLLALSLLIAAGAGVAVAQNNFTDAGLVPTGPSVGKPADITVGTLTFYPDRASFQAAHPGLAMEDFSGGLVGPGGIAGCGPPPILNSATADACYTPGDVIDGFSLEVVVDGGASNQYVVVNTTLGLPCPAVGPNSFVDETDWVFNPAVAAMGVDLYTPLGGGETFNIEVFGPGGSLGSTAIVAAGTAAVFIGVDSIDPGGITRVEVREAVDSNAELFCALEFGDPPVPVELQAFDVE